MERYDVNLEDRGRRWSITVNLYKDITRNDWVCEFEKYVVTGKTKKQAIDKLISKIEVE